ncbi:hypothetical protein PR048_004917 [Dryococelus australis]|uniref:Interleukin-6 n=1 Tax=Dryococelus australis TaxID=614101 RepID=A0ABQ9I6R4_9NEOP|nr:hypothetical protein PR048_004917 [Dryococelus australis]
MIVEELCDPTETVEPEEQHGRFCQHNVLEEVNHTQKYLQNFLISFEKCVIKMRSLKIFLKDKRNEIM